MPWMATAWVLSVIIVTVPSGLSFTCVTRSSLSSESENWMARPASGLVENMTASDDEGDEDMASRVVAVFIVGLGAKGTRNAVAVAARQSRRGSRSCMLVGVSAVEEVGRSRSPSATAGVAGLAAAWLDCMGCDGRAAGQSDRVRMLGASVAPFQGGPRSGFACT